MDNEVKTSLILIAAGLLLIFSKSRLPFPAHDATIITISVFEFQKILFGIILLTAGTVLVVRHYLTREYYPEHRWDRTRSERRMAPILLVLGVLIFLSVAQDISNAMVHITPIGPEVPPPYEFFVFEGPRYAFQIQVFGIFLSTAGLTPLIRTFVLKRYFHEYIS